MRQPSALPPDVSFATYELVTSKTLLTTISKSPNVGYLLSHEPVEVLVSHTENAFFLSLNTTHIIGGGSSPPREVKIKCNFTWPFHFRVQIRSLLVNTGKINVDLCSRVCSTSHIIMIMYSSKHLVNLKTQSGPPCTRPIITTDSIL